MLPREFQTEENKCILLVDDNPTNLLVLEEIIVQKLSGCRILTAETGREGIRLALANPVDAAFIDMQMPGMDGIEMCRRLKGNPATTHIPVVLITSHRSTPELRAQGIDAGAQDFISRPIRNVEMLARIRALLRIKSFEDHLRAENRSLKAAMEERNRVHRWLVGLFTVAQLDFPNDFLALVPPEDGITLEYFQKEIYGQLPQTLKRTILKLSLPEELPLSLAEIHSEVVSIRDVLEYLERQEFYIRTVEKKPLIFLMEPDLKRFLKDNALSELSFADRREVFRGSADWFLERELPEKAICALLEGEDFVRAEEIANQFALSLFIQNRLGKCLSDALTLEREVDSAFPWLIILRALISFDTDPDAFGVGIERAHAIFLEQQRKDGELATGLLLIFYRSLLGIRTGEEAFLLKRTEYLHAEFRDRVSPYRRTFGACCCAMGYLFIEGDLPRAEAHLSSNISCNLSLPAALYAMHYTLRGYLALFSGRWDRARQKVGYAFSPKPSNLPVFADAFRAIFEADLYRAGGFTFPETDKFPDFVEFPETNLYKAITTPSRLFWRISSELAKGCIDSAYEIIRHEEYELSLQGLQRKRFLAYKAVILSLREETEEDRDKEEVASGEDPLFSAERSILQSMVLAGEGKVNEAGEILNIAVELAGSPPCAHLLPSALLQRAFVCIMSGNSRAWEEDLLKGFQLLKEHRTIGFFGMTPSTLDIILSKAHSRGLEREFVERMALHCLEKTFDKNGVRVPILTVRVLGGFALEVNHRLVADQRALGGVQREFLKLFLRRYQMQMGQEEVQGLLWAESDQRKARSNLDSLLLRFRKVSIDEKSGYSLRDYINLRKGVLSLRYCRVDVVQFLESLQKGLKHARKKEFWHADYYFREAYALWIESRDAVGENFNRDDYSDALQLFLEAIICWADILASRERLEVALRVCEEGNRIDPTNDEIIRFLYGNYTKLKSAAKSAKLLDSYRKSLKKEGYSNEEIDDILQDIRTSASVCY